VDPVPDPLLRKSEIPPRIIMLRAVERAVRHMSLSPVRPADSRKERKAGERLGIPVVAEANELLNSHPFFL
jgi:hypothetical protein